METTDQPDIIAIARADLERAIEAAFTRAGRRWLSVASAAEYSDLSTESVRRLIASGKLAAHRPVRGKILIDRLQLDSLIAASTGRLRRGRGRHGEKTRPA